MALRDGPMWSSAPTGSEDRPLRDGAGGDGAGPRPLGGDYGLFGQGAVEEGDDLGAGAGGVGGEFAGIGVLGDAL